MDAEHETAIVDAARAGSDNAWRRLFEWHFDAVYRFCVGLAAGRRDLAEEIAHQAFVTAARRIGRFDRRQGSFRAWLMGIARNRHMAHETGEQRRQRHETLSQERADTPVSPGKRDLQVHEALARLPMHYRVILEAKYVRGLTMKEIAQTDGTSVEASESLLRRARGRFAQIYEQMEDSGQWLAQEVLR